MAQYDAYMADNLSLQKGTQVMASSAKPIHGRKRANPLKFVKAGNR